MECKAILIVEDDQDIRETLQLVLEMAGYTVQTAKNGEEGLERLSQIQRPCLILLDFMMPVMDGKAFVEHINAETMLATIPIVLVTAYSDKAQEMKSVKTTLKKPVDTETLLKVVKTYCGMSS